MNVLIDARPEWADKDTFKANRETAASMTTGVLCATPEEFDALHHRFEFNPEPTTVAGFQCWKGQAPDHPRSLILAQSGMGKVNAATIATILFTTFGCDDLVFSGVAGALVELEVGSVVLVTRAATHDYGLVSDGAFTCVPVGDLPLPGMAQPLQVLPRVPSHVERTLTHLRDRMADKLTIRLGAVLSGDVFINCVEARARLLALGGDIVDMESAAVLEVARRFGKGAYVIRTISDGAGDDSHLSYTEMVTIVAHHSAVCVEDLLKIMP
jgi:adenosylhomocysteine nucleosidase